MLRRYHGRMMPIGPANARLIAEAPAMAELLVIAEGILSDIPDDTESAETRKQINDLLKRLEGKEE